MWLTLNDDFYHFWKIFGVSLLSFSHHFFLFFFFSSSFHSKRRNKERFPHNNNKHTQQTHTTRTKENQSKSILNKSNARRATIGRVLRRTRERARREAIERDRSSSGGEHREEQFRTRWVGQGIFVILFSRGKKSTLASSRIIVFFSPLKALRRSTFGGSFMPLQNAEEYWSSLFFFNFFFSSKKNRCSWTISATWR